MTKDEEFEVYVGAITKWGVRPQLDMVIEECSELIKAIQKFKRAEFGDNETIAINNLEEEVADVEIMIEQLKVMFSASNISAHKNYKLDRLKQRLEK